jgi:lactate dehydrogenase-like 2-hydroxyacid dehydrogenase
MGIDVLVTGANCEPALSELARHFTVHFLPKAPDEEAMLAQVCPDVRAVVTSGTYGASRGFIERFPKLEILCCFGAGYDSLDCDAIRDRNLVFTHAAGTNADGVADLVFAHILGCARRIPMVDAYIKSGEYAAKGRVPLRHTIHEKRLGIIGLGSIGSRVAKRATGFDMDIGYTGPNRKEVPHTYFDSVDDLASFADILVACCPGGDETNGLIGAKTLSALGADGIFVNVARASVVDGDALINALQNGIIGSAGLDLFEGQPTPPSSLAALDNVVLTPHIGGRCFESFDNGTRQLIDNLTNHFAGKPVVSPVPGFEDCGASTL